MNNFTDVHKDQMFKLHCKSLFSISDMEHISRIKLLDRTWLF